MDESLTTNTGEKEKRRFFGSIRAKIEEIWLRLIRLYTYNTPINKGKYRIFLTALSFCRYAPAPVQVQINDGRKIWTDFSTGMHETVFFLGEYENFLTEIVTSLLDKGDVCLDVGANFGWYSTLFQKNCGAEGEVHCFEPMPPSFQQLKRNYKLMGEPDNIFINNLALGDREEKLQINLFPDASSGHASLSARGHGSATSFDCQMIRLDSYLEEKNIENVNFVKVDIEGAEMMFLKGAEKLFEQSVPPIWLIEMALAETKNFGYLPNDLIIFMRERADYRFFRVDEIKNKLIEFSGFKEKEIGANVFCFPNKFYRDRIKRVAKFLV